MSRILSLLSITALLLLPVTAAAIDLSNTSKHNVRIKITGEFDKTCYTSTLAPGQTTFFAASRPACQKDLKIDYQYENGEKPRACAMTAKSGDRVSFDGSACGGC